jgi:hypothetical protein
MDVDHAPGQEALSMFQHFKQILQIQINVKDVMVKYLKLRSFPHVLASFMPLATGVPNVQ